MHLSVFSDYSLRVLIYGALKKGAFNLSEVTNAYGISRNHLAKVVHQLSRLGYLETRRGRGGGIQLARPPETIRVGEVVKATEDQHDFVECFDAVNNTCRLNGSCRLKGYLADARNAFYESLNRHTLNDLVTGSQKSRMKQILVPPGPG